MSNSKINSQNNVPLVQYMLSAWASLGRPVTEDLINQLMQTWEGLLQGIPEERQFMALVTWLGKCKLIHSLEQHQYPKHSKETYQVPDFFAIFSHNGHDLPVLIEVKKTQEFKIKKSASYIKKLKRYADLLNLPLLIAWKVTDFGLGYWNLLDVDSITSSDKPLNIDFTTAQDNILGLLAGDFALTIKRNVGFYFQTELIGNKKDQQKMREKNNFFGKMSFQIKDGDKNELSSSELSPGLSAIMDCVPHLAEYSTSESESNHSWSFALPQEQVLFGQQILSILVTAPFLTPEYSRVKDKKTIWWDILEKIDSLPSVRAIAEAAMNNKNIVDKIILIRPHNVPDFLKEVEG